MERQFYFYIMTDRGNSVFFTGVTDNLKSRVSRHKDKHLGGLNGTYHVDKLVYFEVRGDAYQAVAREQQIKAGSRQKKIDLIGSKNPQWRDLSDEI